MKKLLVLVLIGFALSQSGYAYTTWNLYVQRFDLSNWYFVRSFSSSTQCEYAAWNYTQQDIRAQCVPEQERI